MIIPGMSGGGHGWILRSIDGRMIMERLCTCGEPIHVGTIVSAPVAEGGPMVAPETRVRGVVASVRQVQAFAGMMDVYPPIPAQAAFTSLNVLTTSAQGWPAPPRGGYWSIGTDDAGLIVSGCAA